MKRSTQIGLAAVGVVLVASYWSLSGGETEDSLIYGNVAECRAANQLGASQCEQRFNEAAANTVSVDFAVSPLFSPPQPPTVSTTSAAPTATRRIIRRPSRPPRSWP